MGWDIPIPGHLLYGSVVEADHGRNLESVHIVLNRSCSLGERSFCVSHPLLSVTLPARCFAQGGAKRCFGAADPSMSNESFLPMRHTNYLFFALQAPFPPARVLPSRSPSLLALPCNASRKIVANMQGSSGIGTTASRSSRWSAEWTSVLLTPVWRTMRFYQSLTNIYFPQSGQRHRQPSGV